MEINYEVFSSLLAESESVNPDSYLNSAIYYLMTGRKGVSLYRKENVSLVVCTHPHLADCLMVFPEIGRQPDYSLTVSVLNNITPPANGLRLSRYTQEDLEVLQTQLKNHPYSMIQGFEPFEEEIMDWKYPIHLLDTKKVAQHQGKELGKVRGKLRQSGNRITIVDLVNDDMPRLVKSVLRKWESNMIWFGKDTEDMGNLYIKLLDFQQRFPGYLEGFSYYEGHRPVGFTIWEKGTNRTANLFCNLCDTYVVGLAELQIVSCCGHLYKDGIRYMNLGGAETEKLNNFKMKFSPVKSIPAFSAKVVYKETTSEKDFKKYHVLV